MNINKRRMHNCKETKLIICYFGARNHGQDLQMVLHEPWVSQNVRTTQAADSFFIAKLRKYRFVCFFL